MGTVLLGWELGDGLGHVEKLIGVARELAAHGHTPVLALRNLTVAKPLLRNAPFRVVQAPVCWEAVPKSFRASSYSDILSVKGYANVDSLGILVDAWRALIELTGTEMVICDFAPTLGLAAYGVLPAVSIGTGFTLPPARGKDFPPFGPRFGTGSSTDRLLEVAREVQRRRGRPEPETLPSLLAGSACFVHTFDEIDLYRSERGGTVVEPLRTPDRPLDAAPSRSFYAYMNAEYPGVDLILPQLGKAGFRGSAYVRGASGRLIDCGRSAGITMHDEPVPLEDALRNAAVVIHHGGLNTAERALSAGRPQLTLPIHTEHILNARALDRLGVGGR